MAPFLAAFHRVDRRSVVPAPRIDSHQDWSLCLLNANTNADALSPPCQKNTLSLRAHASFRGPYLRVIPACEWVLGLLSTRSPDTSFVAGNTREWSTSRPTEQYRPIE